MEKYQMKGNFQKLSKYTTCLFQKVFRKQLKYEIKKSKRANYRFDFFIGMPTLLDIKFVLFDMSSKYAPFISGSKKL